MSDIKQEKLIKEQPIPVSLENTKKILFQMENCICKIYMNNGGIGTGFLCKIPFNNNLLPVLITNNHVLNKNDIDNNKIIKLMINNKAKKIEIDNSRKKYTNSDKNIDITIIEIKPKKDGINNYLEIDDINKDKDTIELEYKNKSIYIIHYPNEELSVSYGLIKNIIDNRRINHYCNTEEGSSGSPILSLKTFKVIGIHYGGSQTLKLNYGTYIKYGIDEFNKYNNKNIKLMINNEIKTIKIDESRKKYTNSDENIDITIIEIKPKEDGINNYLEIEEDDIKKYKEKIKLEFKKKSIYIIHYPKEELSVSYGLINDIIDNRRINHYCNTEEGSSGGPILSLKTFKVIGIHCGSFQKSDFNYGIFIKYAIDEFNKYNKFKNEINII